jgi:hypothetical protein
MKTQIVSIMAGCFCAISFCPTRTEATLITTEIEAVVDSVSDEGNYLEGKIKVGDIITGFYTYDSSVTRLPGERYEFDSPPSGVFLSVGGFDFETDPTSVDFEMGIGNDLSWGDTYFFISFNNLRLSNGTLVDGISWSLEDPTGTALSSDTLPTSAPILDQWGDNRLRLHGERGRYIVDAEVSSAIPEPATVILLGMGGFLLSRRSRNKNRNYKRSWK